MRLTLLISLLLIACQVQAQVRTFEAPTQGGYPVSYCGARGCGAAVATAWCKSQDFQQATGWTIEPGVDVGSVAVQLDNGELCRGQQCDAFGSITCRRTDRGFSMPRLGAAGRATVIAPNRNAEVTTFDFSDAEILVPGCREDSPGVYLCPTLHEYQHCRTLMKTGTVFGCRAGLAFDGGFAIPIAAAPDEYEMTIESNATVRVEQGRRGEGKVKGLARVEVQFAPQVSNATVWCLQRDRYVYHPSGPQGGASEIDDPAECEEPVVVEFEPHEDDVLRAYDTCATFAAWGGDVEDSIDILVAALFQVGSASPTFQAEHGGSNAVFAPYLTVKAPLKIECRE